MTKRFNETIGFATAQIFRAARSLGITNPVVLVDAAVLVGASCSRAANMPGGLRQNAKDVLQRAAMDPIIPTEVRDICLLVATTIPTDEEEE